MKTKLVVYLFCVSFFSFGQTDHISMIDYVQVLNGNKTEALYYYQNNWEQLRKKAKKKNLIESYQLLETKPTADMPYTFILITTFKNRAQYDLRESNFQKLIDNRGKLKLLNDKTPTDFRKVILHNDAVLHWN